MKVAILTGGGDCPGGCRDRAVVRWGDQHALELVGVRDLAEVSFG